MQLIENSTSLETLRQTLPEDKNFSEEDILLMQKHRLVKAYEPIKEYLNDEHMNIYKAALVETGLPEHPDFQIWCSACSTGPNSPKTHEELMKMSVSEVVDFLIRWKPEVAFMAPSPEGFQRVLANVITEKSE